jgi:hypothetical protein
VKDKAVQGGTVELSDVQKSGKVIAEGAPVDQGKWNVAKLGSKGLLLKVDGMNLKFSEDELGKLKIILETRKYASVKATGGKRYIFAPIKGGGFSVKQMDDEEVFPDGILISKEQVVEIMDMISETD